LKFLCIISFSAAIRSEILWGNGGAILVHMFIWVNGGDAWELHSVLTEELTESRIGISINALLRSVESSIEEVQVVEILG